MIITHKIGWQKCLSHQIWPAIEKGWKDDGRPTHFFWGLADNNLKGIRDCIDKNEDWYYVDVGYLTQQITRYPEPKIHDYDKTYFRICKGNIHTIRGKVGSGVRLQKLESQGIDVEFKGWNTGETRHILLCPSSQMVTYHVNGLSQEEWVYNVSQEIKKYTDRPIVFRNKPRPNNQWWQTDIKTDLKGLDKILYILKNLNATKYISGDGDGSKRYIDEKLFSDQGIELVWQNYKHPIYKQQFNEFIPYMSILDLLFNEGPNSKNII